MQINVVSWDGHSLNDASYSAKIPRLENLADVEPIEVMRTDEYPNYAGKEISGKYFGILVEMKGTPATQIDTLKTWFDTKSKTLKKLIVADPNNSNKQWGLWCACTSNPRINGKMAEFVVYTPDPVMQAESPTVTNWSITASGQTQAVTVGGNVPAKPVITVTPTNAKTGGYGYKRFITVLNAHASNAFTDYPFDLTDGGWDTATLVSGSKMQADGDDLRVFVDGLEVPRWLQDINTGSTKVWINLSLKPQQTAGLKTAIASSGAVSTISVGVSRNHLKMLKAINSTGGIVAIGTELFTYTGVDTTNYQLTGCVRAAKGTSMAAHSVSDDVVWVEHDIWIMYGNTTATAPDQDESKKPIIELTSTNNSWVYTIFNESTGLRTGSWSPTVSASSGKVSTYYTATQNAEADPTTDMGMTIPAYQVGAKWKGETGGVQWNLYHPAGGTVVTSNGYQYRNSSSWPTSAGLWKGATASRYINVWNLTAGTISSWDAWTKNAQSLSGTYNYLRFYFYGSVGAVADAVANMEISGATIGINSSYRPSITFGAEQGNYWIDATITNNTSGEWIKVTWMIGTNTSIVIDCANKTAVYAGGANVVQALTFSSVRSTWLDLAVGSNTLQYDDTGLSTVTVSLSVADRNN